MAGKCPCRPFLNFQDPPLVDENLIHETSYPISVKLLFL